MKILKRKEIGDELQLKSIRYTWARDLLDQAVANTWFPNEIPMEEDLMDWNKLTADEKNAVVMYIGFSNPMEFDVNESICYGMLPFISAPEVRNYLVRQLWEEVNHSRTFEYIINTLSIDRVKAFDTHINVPQVKAKEEFLVSSIEDLAHGNVDVTTVSGIQRFVKNIVKTNIVTEGIWFYTGFMFALSFRQRGIMRNMGSLTDWINRDEGLHLKAGINLILTILEEYPEIATPEFASEIKDIILEAVNLETKYNEALLPNGILGLNTNLVNQYVKYVADRRLEELGFPAHFNVPNPVKWMATANDTLQMVNFFEVQNTSYEVNNKSSSK